MAYTKQTWADLPSKTTPINATRLTHIEDGIFNAAQTADTAASTAGTAAANIGIVSSRVETLTERVNGLDTAVSNKVDKVAGKGLSTNDYDNTDKGKVDNLGTASTKNAISVVTDSTDLVESGAVKDIVGWGNKNLLPPDYSDGNSKSQNGVTFTKNSDGTVTISIAQSATGNAYYYMYTTLEDFIERGKKYIVNSFLDNNSITFSCNDKVNNAWGNAVNSNGSDVEWTPRAEATAYGIWILVLSGTTAGTYVVKPMISKNGGAYEPYHESVSDSLEEKADNSVIGTVEDGTNPTKSYAVGEHMIRGGKFCTVTSPVTTSSTWTLGSNYVEGDVAECLNLANLHIILSTATNNREIIEQLFTNIIPLLKNDLDSCYGVVKQGGVNTLGFNCFRNSSTTFYAFLYSNDRIFNALYNNGTVTIYQNVGTILN